MNRSRTASNRDAGWSKSPTISCVGLGIWNNCGRGRRCIAVSFDAASFDAASTWSRINGTLPSGPTKGNVRPSRLVLLTRRRFRVVTPPSWPGSVLNSPNPSSLLLFNTIPRRIVGYTLYGEFNEAGPRTKYELSLGLDCPLPSVAKLDSRLASFLPISSAHPFGVLAS